MIIINGIFENGMFIPERELTDEEFATVTSEKLNGLDNTKIFYQGDEPEQTENLPSREVASWKIKGILELQGLTEPIEGALEQLQEPTKTLAKMAWKHSESFSETSQTVLFIKTVCGLTDQQFKNIFDQAEQVNI